MATRFAPIEAARMGAIALIALIGGRRDGMTVADLRREIHRDTGYALRSAVELGAGAAAGARAWAAVRDGEDAEEMLSALPDGAVMVAEVTVETRGGSPGVTVTGDPRATAPSALLAGETRRELELEVTTRRWAIVPVV